jgi:hypothetical protein
MLFELLADATPEEVFCEKKKVMFVSFPRFKRLGIC